MSLDALENDVIRSADSHAENVEGDGTAAPATTPSVDEETEAQTDNLARQTGDWEVYVYYFKTWGVISTVIFTLSLAVVVFGAKFPVVWLSWWADEERDHPSEKSYFYMGVMVAFAASSLLGLFIAVGTLFVVIVPAVGNKIHRRILESAMQAPYFFSTLTDVGTTLNR